MEKWEILDPGLSTVDAALKSVTKIGRGIGRSRDLLGTPLDSDTTAYQLRCYGLV
jgi:hypothetical protein